MAKELVQTTSQFKLVGNIEKFNPEKNITSKETWDSLSLTIKTGEDAPQVSVMAFHPKADKLYTVFRSTKGKDGKRKTEKKSVKESELKKFKSADGWQVGGGITIAIPKKDDDGNLELNDKKQIQRARHSLPPHQAVSQLKRLLGRHFSNENATPLGVMATGEVNVYVNKDGEVKQSLKLLNLTILDGGEYDLENAKKEVNAFNVQGVFDHATPLEDSDAVRVTLGHIDFKEEVVKNSYLIDPSIGKTEEEVEKLKKLAESALTVMEFGDLIKLEGLVINRPNRGGDSSGGGDPLAELFGGLGVSGSQTRGGFNGYTSEMKLTRVLEFSKGHYSEEDFLKSDELDEDDIDSGVDLSDDSDPFDDDDLDLG